MSRNHLRLIWADKIALSLAILLLAIPALGWALVALAAGAAGANHVLASFGTDGVAEVAAGLFAVWASLRAIDFAAGGATYKLFYVAQADHEPTKPVSEISSRKLLAH